MSPPFPNADVCLYVCDMTQEEAAEEGVEVANNQGFVAEGMNR